MKNKVLKSAAMVASVAFVVAGSMVDSQSWLPTWICVGCIAFLAVFAYANRGEG